MILQARVSTRNMVTGDQENQGSSSRNDALPSKTGALSNKTRDLAHKPMVSNRVWQIVEFGF